MTRKASCRFCARLLMEASGVPRSAIHLHRDGVGPVRPGRGNALCQRSIRAVRLAKRDSRASVAEPAGCGQGAGGPRARFPRNHHHPELCRPACAGFGEVVTGFTRQFGRRGERPGPTNACGYLAHERSSITTEICPVPGEAAGNPDAPTRDRAPVRGATVHSSFATSPIRIGRFGARCCRPRVSTRSGRLTNPLFCRPTP
jgi:hypothetical protein